MRHDHFLRNQAPERQPERQPEEPRVRWGVVVLTGLSFGVLIYLGISAAVPGLFP